MSFAGKAASALLWNAGRALPIQKNKIVVTNFYGRGYGDNLKPIVEELLKHVEGKWVDKSDPNAVHEAGLLNLDIAKARKVLGWRPTWNFEETIAKVAEWYVGVNAGEKALALTQKQINEFNGGK